ncbi:MAG: tetratricopeptide repeat protein, partial [Muribaculaceae bacterium]|nr:tetratricopeptide repeat protein [Muribaculaceae bacterium]
EADLLIKQKEWDKGAEMLSKAIGHVSKAQRTRLYFLLGQVYALAGKKQQAYKAFQAAGGSSSASYRTKFNARIKQSEVFTGEDVSKEVAALRRMTRYDRNKEYLDQIYYAIGNLYLSRRDTARAIENYELAVEKSTRSGIDKAMAQLTLGGLYYDRRLYAKAQPCYSEALPVIPDNYPGYAGLKRRSDVLDELAVYSQNVELQDSLLRLAAMTPEQQMKVIEKLIDELKEKEKKEAEAAAREEFLANRGQDGLQDQNNQVFTMNNGDDSWYFYNTATKNAGRTEFQRRWGNRKLEDDWRRRNKATFSLEDEEEVEDGDEEKDGKGEEADSEGKKEADSNDPHNVEFYLKQIPSTPEQVATANDVIQEGLYNMGVILKDKLEDYPAARIEFNELDTRYPDNIYRLDVYYNMYLMAVRENDAELAEVWRKKILADFPDSPYGKAMADPQYFNNLRRMHEVQGGMYEEAYAAYLDNENKRVHELTSEMEKDYPLSPILPKFVFIDALSYMTEGDYGKFRDRLTELLGRWPDT